MAAPEEEVNPSFPLTLDLRLPAPEAKTPTERSGVAR
jgi:hypothetical protein